MDNLRGAMLMTLSMLGFAIEDMLIKLMAGALPIGQIIFVLGLGGTLVFALAVRGQGHRLWPAGRRDPAVILRNIGEVTGTFGFVTAIVLTPLSSASAILMATPLAVTLGAAVILKEPVGIRRWSAIAVGFSGVLLILRPGLDGFDVNSLFAVLGVVGLAIRDLATRKVSGAVSSLQLSLLAFLALIPTGLVLSALSRATLVLPDIKLSGLIVLAIVITCVARAID